MEKCSVLLRFLIGLYLVAVWAGADPADREQPTESINVSTVIVSGDLREQVRCDFEEPLKHVTLVMHWYDSNEEMYADYVTLADPVKHDEIWGWSNCSWQPDDDFAACDVYVVKPQYVRADMNMDTIGHEVLHGACGYFHD